VEPNDAVVFLVPGAVDEPGGLGPIDQAHGAVVAQHQVVGHFTHSRGRGLAVAPDGQQELVLRR
jgi:hypothetical protein